jgi:leucyl-tRNA synthetase
MYARFFTKALADLGHLNFQEPFRALFTQGMVTKDGAKMSKSRGNVISPAAIVERYGADTARSYILFVGPPDQDTDWSDEGVEGVYRFLGRLWRLAAETADRAGAPIRDLPRTSGAQGDDLALLRKAHWAIDKVSGDLRRFAFNTAIAAVMELLNECSRLRDSVELGTLGFALSTAASLLFPFAPHVCAEVHERLRGERVWEQPWPQAEPALLEREVYELVCQVNGKLRDRVQAAADASDDELAALCRSAPNVRAHLDGREIVKQIVVPGKLVNLVVR